jgi:hypothetical protein
VSPRGGKPAAECVAPLGDVPDDATLDDVRLCGAVAVTTRVIEGMECPLCARHAAEVDAENDTTE